MSTGLGSLHAERVRTVTAPDGTDLHVEVDGPDTATDAGTDAATATIVFAHGFAVSLGCWDRQRTALAGLGRLVFYDHRGHGRSAPGPAAARTFDTLAGDLAAVIDATAPPGSPVIVVGQSMGGMAIMALAARSPELFGDRITGAALLDTSACLNAPARSSGRNADRPNPALAAAVRGVRLQARGPLMHEISAWLNGLLVFASPLRHRALVPQVARLMRGCPPETQLAFMAELTSFDLRDRIGALRRVPTLVTAGSHDRLVPLAHKTSLARALPDGRHEMIRDAGHATILERPEIVGDLLRDLVARAAARSGPA